MNEKPQISADGGQKRNVLLYVVCAIGLVGFLYSSVRVWQEPEQWQERLVHFFGFASLACLASASIIGQKRPRIRRFLTVLALLLSLGFVTMTIVSNYQEKAKSSSK